MRIEQDPDPADLTEENQPDNTSRAVNQMRLTQRRQFDQYVAKEPVPTRETPAVSLKEILERRSDYQRSEIPPEAILEAVEKAVEQDVPLEASFERRHEVKDEDQATWIPPTTTAAAAVSQQFMAPVASGSTPMVNIHQSEPIEPKPISIKQPPLSPVRFRMPTSPYMQAVLGGITAGVIALLVFAVTLLLK